jgi:hypothetical protein
MDFAATMMPLRVVEESKLPSSRSKNLVSTTTPKKNAAASLSKRSSVFWGDGRQKSDFAWP